LLRALLLAGLALAGSAASTQAQAPAQALLASRQLSLILGQSLASYHDDCDPPESFFTLVRGSLTGERFGVSVAHVHEDWPWPPDEELQGEFLLRHGDALQIVGEAYPLGFLGFGDTRVGRMVRPFVGAGVHVSRDADRTGGPTNRVVYGVRGSVDPIAVVGASLFVRPATLPVTLHVQFRRTALFASDFELEGPGGTDIQLEGETLGWNDLSIGFSFGLGG
jgi:hypothetical protein